MATLFFETEIYENYNRSGPQTTGTRD